jgi:hypothetical protein
MELGRDEREHLDQADPPQFAGRRELRRALRDPAEDRAVLGPFRPEIDPDPVELEPGLMQRDMVGEAARPGSEIELHRTCSLLSAVLACRHSRGAPHGCRP